MNKKQMEKMVTLDATEEGKSLYESCGFEYIKDGMERCFFDE